jgi:gamma-glutamyltranspeptidase/glutathione hydrolase
MKYVVHLRSVVTTCILIALISGTTASAAYRAPVCSRDGMAATPHTEATNGAVEILAKGGNAVDAALCAVFVLAVVEQYHSGLGGGEFMMVQPKSGSPVEALDAREYAPAALTADLFIDPATNSPYPDKSSVGGMAVGVPGSVAGRAELHRKYGKLAWRELLLPAIRCAKEGFVVDRILADRIKSNQDVFAESQATADIFLPNGKPLLRGDRLVQPALAKTLELIARDGGRDFYSGSGASSIARAVQSSGGVLTEGDLAGYKFVWRKPIQIDYHGYTIYSMPPPSSGGLCLAEILNILEPLPLKFLGNGTAESIHLIASAFERAFADRSRWLADPDFVPQPVDGMSSKEYATQQSKSIRRDVRTPIKESGDPWKYGSGNTSHISVMDKWGGSCAITTSVNGAFGSLVFVPELGIFLNNTMDDFAITATKANIYDLTQGEVNLVEPGKRPLSSMSPTIITKDGSPYACIGSVGGPRIISSVAMMIVNLIDYGMDVQAAIDAPRIHMQWKPELLYLEEETTIDVVKVLRSMDWEVKKEGRWSISQGVTVDWEKGLFYGGADARGVGSAGPSSIP